jgi:DnaK suppressor protein
MHDFKPGPSADPSLAMLRCSCDRLTWKNSSLNTGTKIRAGQPRERRGDHKRISGERMGKSNRSRTARKPAAGKARAKASANGRDRAAVKTKPAKVARKAKRRTAPRRSTIVLPAGYRPAESEPFMNERHRAYFRNKLVAWKEEIVRQNRETLNLLHEDSAQHADIADRATSETDRALELRARDRQRKLIAKIDAALARIEDGSYGYCEETGEPIGLKRLDARPIATLSLEAQERHERREKVFRED